MSAPKQLERECEARDNAHGLNSSLVCSDGRCLALPKLVLLGLIDEGQVEEGCSFWRWPASVARIRGRLFLLRLAADRTCYVSGELHF
jgi:hypothetical protein